MLFDFGAKLFLLTTVLAQITLVLSQTSNQLSVKSTVLIITISSNDPTTATYVLNAYGIPYQILTVPQGGTALPALNNTLSGGAVEGQYGLFVIQSQVSYDYGNSTWHSALTTAQWQSLYDYQAAFKVRMVHLNAYPTNFSFGADALGGCCVPGDEQYVKLSAAVQSSRFPTAGLKSAQLSTNGVWHYPAKIIDRNATRTTPFLTFATNAQFTKNTVGGVINTYPGREQMVFFVSFATWSPTSTYLSHIWIHWGTRGLYSGIRRAHLSTQIDDLLLATNMYAPSDALYRSTPADLQAHATWDTKLNAKLNAKNPGSTHFLEMGFNGNGDLIQGQMLDESLNICTIPPIVLNMINTEVVDAEFIKPLGTGPNAWPDSAPASFRSWTNACVKLDSLTSWFMTPANRDNFAFISHTFTHLALDNSTYKDTFREIQFNKQFAAAVGLSSAQRYSKGGLIPPAITGLHNGDALQAFHDNGLQHAVGDNTRSVLRSPFSPHWPLVTNKTENGFDGYYIIPRFATRIYYNCDTTFCTVTEWNDMTIADNTDGDITDLLSLEKESTTNQLLGLYHDPYMFHQANLRTASINSTLVNGSLQKLSLVQIWVETIVAEYQRLVTWPLISLKQDDLASSYKARMKRDKCKPKMTSILSSDGNSVVAVVVTTKQNTCSRPIPVTVPGTVVNLPAGATTEQVGNDPLTVWVTMNGAPVTLTLGSPVNLLLL